MGIRISEMEEATTFGADDYVPIVTNGTNKKALGAKIKDFIAGFFATKTGDNISDKATFRSAIEISATNTPFDKTGTGMSAENVQAAIAELSGNRALINGSNIVDKATFRSNIGLQIDTFSFNGTPNNWFDIVTDCPLNGYVPLGFIGTSLSRSHWDYTFVYDGNTSSTYWAVRVASPVSTVSGTYSGSFLALKIN